MMRSPWAMAFMMFVTALCLNACHDGGDANSSAAPSGSSPTSYSYKGYNSRGVLVVVGSIELTVLDNKTVNGTWTLQGVIPGENVGPQTGNGTLIGSINGPQVTINMNPGWADNNVFLTGSFGKDSFSGTWMWSTLAGPTSQGTFEALKSQ